MGYIFSMENLVGKEDDSVGHHPPLSLSRDAKAQKWLKTQTQWIKADRSWQAKCTAIDIYLLKP